MVWVTALGSNEGRVTGSDGSFVGPLAARVAFDTLGHGG